MDCYAYVDIARSGESNMAIDRRLLETSESLRCAFVRLYRWSTPTLSLGHFQASSDRNLHPASACLPSVLRASGGGAIVHDHEWTYSIALPVGRNHVGAATQLYDIVHDALVEGLQRLGWDTAKWSPACASGLNSVRATPDNQPFLCFNRRSCGDIVCAGYKIVGSAQRRLGTSVLQHGSLLCAASQHAPELLGLAELPCEDREKSVHQSETFGKSMLSWILAPLTEHFEIFPKNVNRFPEHVAQAVGNFNAVSAIQ
jgi:lipoyl(octanoyl) transferase